MVQVVTPSKPKAWFSGMRGLGHQAGGRLVPLFHRHHDQGGSAGDPCHLGILAFEAARTMSRLVALHRSLSDAEVARLRSDVMRSEGVGYLNTRDQRVLLRLACAEMLDDLDAAAATVARLAGRCRGVWPNGFEHVFAELKAGKGDIARLGLGMQPKDVEKKVKKMERYVASTSALHVAMEGLAELEAGWRLGKWKPYTAAGQKDEDVEISLQKRIRLQRDRVRQLREESLWGRSVDKVAEVMARSVVSIFVRICTVYGSFVVELPRIAVSRRGRVEFAPHCHCGLSLHHHHHATPTAGVYSSGPLERPPVGNVVIRNSGPILRSGARSDAVDGKPWKDQALELPPNTLGASGLALRYANVVTLLQKLASSPALVAEETREELYWMLPEGLRGAVMAKLRSHRRMDDCEGPSDDLASGWKEAVVAILGWLAPVAHNTERWHSERSFEQRQLGSGPKVLRLQTFVFSDREKVEAAIVELLVAFSCVCWYRPGAEDVNGS